VIVLDTTAVVALQDRRDAHYEAALGAARDEPGPFVIPLAILAEVDAVLSGRSLGATAHVLASLLDGSSLLDTGGDDLERVAALLSGAGSARPSFADAAVVACAERLGAPVLTFAPQAYRRLADVSVALLPSSA